MTKCLLALCVLAAFCAHAQFTQQGTKLLGSGSVGSTPEQGTSVALSSDGNTAVVGGWDDNGGTGAIWIFTRSGGVWTQQGPKLVGTGGATPSYQGSSVAISADGNTVIEGGYFDNTRVGAAWVFTRSGGVWSQQGNKLVGNDYVNVGGHQSYQGYSVGISADGNTAIVGGEWDNYPVGAAWIYQRSGGLWSQVGNKLVASDWSGNPMQGCAVAISGNGKTAVVGGLNDAPDYGSAWIYVLNGSTWKQQGNKLALGFNSAFGEAVALSSDGNTVIVGGGSDYDYAGIGAAWVFVRSTLDSTWTLQGTQLGASDYSGTPQFGTSVSLAADGNTALVGGFTDNANAGGAWIFKRSLLDNVWTQSGNKLVGPDTSGKSRQGFSVSISADGNTALVGGYADSNFVGATWVFATPAASLPVELISFFGTVSGNNATLFWKTAIEANNAKFEIERRLTFAGAVSSSGEGQGQNEYFKVGELPGAGTTNSPRNYSFTDKTVVPGRYLYRLKQIDRDGAFKYSQELTLEIGVLPDQFSLLQNYPNPFNPSTTINYSIGSRSYVTISVFNSLGQKIAEPVNGEREPGTYDITFEINGLSSGIYLYLMNAGSFVQAKKMIVVK